MPETPLPPSDAPEPPKHAEVAAPAELAADVKSDVAGSSPSGSTESVPAAPLMDDLDTARPVPEAKKGKLLRRFFLMEEEIAAAAAESAGFVTGEGPVFVSRARAAREVAAALFTGARELHASDGTAAATTLAREALFWGAAAHQGSIPEPRTPAGAWAVLQSAPTAKAALAPITPDVIGRAHVAFVDRGFIETAELSPIERQQDLSALRTVTDRLVADIEVVEQRLARVRGLRIVRWIAAAAVLALVAVGLRTVWDRTTSGKNLAPSARITASSEDRWIAGTKGVVDGDMTTFGFHTKVEDEPWLLFDFGSPRTVKKLEIYNRLDCCGDQTYPLMVEVSDDGRTFRELDRRTKYFTVWSTRVAPTKTRYVRLRVLKHAQFHLNEVEIYGN
jgi:hypothetical protein